jgi:peptide chain release factor subunit 1
VREGLLQDWFKKIAEASNKIFTEHKEVIGIIISGPGPIKEFFLREELLHDVVTKKILGNVDTSYTGEYGLHETLEKAGDLLKEASVTKEKKILQRFFQELQKPHGLAIYGKEKVREFLERGSVDTVVLIEDLPEQIEDRDIFEWFEEAVESYGSKLTVVSPETREGQQFRALGGVGAFLRY